MAEVPIVPVCLATVSVQGLLYGIFLVLFIASTYVHVRRQQQLKASGMPFRSAYRAPLFVAGIAMFLTITAHWILTVYRSFQAFIFFEDGQMPIYFFANPAQLTNVVQTAFLFASLLFADAVMVYRLWVIWDYNFYVMIVALCTFLADVACSIAVIYQLSRFYQQGAFINDNWIVCLNVFKLSTNIYCASLIALRLWYANRKIALLPGNSRSWNAFAVFIESAALYVSWTIFEFATYEAGSTLTYAADATWAPVSGIAFTLITVRVALARPSPSPTVTPMPLRPSYHMSVIDICGPPAASVEQKTQEFVAV